MTVTILRVLLLIIAAYAVISLLVWLFAERVMFQPPPPSYDEATLDFRRIPVPGRAHAGSTRAPNGATDSIALVHLPNPAAEFTILHSHGNAEDLGQMRPLLELLRRGGFQVVAYDYRGYGRSGDGPPSALRAIADAEAAYHWIVGELGVPPERIIVHGRSIGSGPSLEVATRHPVAAVVLESAFLSAYRVMTQFPILPFDRFPNLVRLRSLDRPLLVIHGTRDFIIPVWHGRRLFAAATEPKAALWVEGAGHNDVALVAGRRYVEAFRALARAATAAGATD